MNRVAFYFSFLDHGIDNTSSKVNKNILIVILFFFLDKVDWCQSGMGNHMIHRPMSDPGVFSQHQAMERDSTGIVTPSGTFHQHVPAGYMDFSKVGVT